MSIITKITDHVEQAESRVITQYKDSPNIKAIIEIYAKQVQELENAIFDMIDQRTLNGSVGFQLDQLGTILGQPRQGLNDDDYRLRLKAKIAENVSEGTPNEMIEIFKILVATDDVEYLEVFPASFKLTVNDLIDPISSPSEINNAIRNSKPAGVGFSLVMSMSPAFEFTDDPSTPDLVDGFSDLSFPGVDGGFLAELII